MLKFTNSFYRYLWLTYEHLYSRINVKTHLSSRRKSLSHLPSSLSLLTPSQQTEQQTRLFANIKKRSRNKSSQKTNDPKKSKPMSDSLQPTLNHTSYGGRFDIASTDGTQPSTNQWKKCPTQAGTSRKLQIPPDFRVWERVTSGNENSHSVRFRVVSYNVLAQYLLECHPYLYAECSAVDLKWHVRCARIYEEIISLAPDILCLQEVQASHLGSFYKLFEYEGYVGVYKQKTGDKHDGCAIYYKRDLFNMLGHISVEYYQPSLPILNRDNVGMMVKLAPKSAPESPFVVATTHLLYNPKRTDVRLAQLQVLLAEIDRFAYCENGVASRHLPIVLTGDLNSTPDSAVIKLLDDGHVSCRGAARVDRSGWHQIGVTDNCQHLAVYLARQSGEAGTRTTTKLRNTESDQGTDGTGPTDDGGPSYSERFDSGALAHSLCLTSVYDRVKPHGQHEASTYQDYWVTVDYIYFSALRLVERLRLPTAQECEVLGTLPNHVYASDHLALGAVFELRPNPRL